MRIPFSKFRGLEVEDVPTGYLHWVLSLDDLRQPLRTTIEDELRSRNLDVDQGAEIVPAEVRVAVEALISAGLHQLAIRNHPDRGGDSEAMTRVNLAAAWLRAHVRGLPS